MKVSPSMKLQTLLPTIQAEPLTDRAEAELRGGYVSDLLSDVLAHAQPGMLWATTQIHRNVVSVAAMKDVAAVLFTGGRRPEPAIVAEADEEEVILLSSPLSTYEAAGKLWEAGLR